VSELQATDSATSTGQAAGSPSSGEKSVEKAETSSTAVVKEKGGGEDLAAQNHELRRKLTELSEERADHTALVDLINDDPALKKAVLARAAGRSEEGDGLQEIDREVDELFDEESAQPLKRLLRRVLEVGERRAEERMRPLLGEVKGTMAESQLRRALQAAGLDPAVTDGPDFRDHLKGLQASKSFRVMMRQDPGGAADWAASKWKVLHASAEGYDRERRRIEDVRAASLVTRGSHGAETSSASRTVKIPFTSGMRAVHDALQRGVRKEDIELE